VQLHDLVARLGRNIRRARLRAALSQEHVAYKAGLTARSFGALERGESRNPTLSTILAVATTLGLDVHDLTRPVREGKEPKPLGRGRRPGVHGRKSPASSR
jgi:transcriptional regulator with XRE-family HTH domain